MKSIFSLAMAVMIGAGSMAGQSGQGSDTVSSKATEPTASATRVVDSNTAVPAQTGYVRPDAKKRLHKYLMSMVGPVAIGKSVVSAGWGTWRNSPEEWGDKWEGFGKRVASGVGKNMIKSTVIYGLDESLKYDSAYYRSRKKDVGSRLKNALISPVAARDKNGKRVVGIPRIVGTYSASIIAAETWYPRRYDFKDGLKSGTVSLGMNAVFNLVKEFVWK